MIAAIVSGDDFGLAPAINEGILKAHVHGCLTSASLIVVGSAAEEAAAAALDHPKLGVGLHLTLVAERPLSALNDVPTLVGADGRFCSSATTFAQRWTRGLIRRDEVRLEIRRQLERCGELGIEPTHLDSHQHLHVLPGLTDLVVREMQHAGIGRLRIPLELGTPARAGWTRRLKRSLLNMMARRAASSARRAGLLFPDRFSGFLGAGRIDAESLVERVLSLKEGVTELALHPAVGVGPPHPDLASWGYRWDTELAALLDPRVRDALVKHKVELINYKRIR